MVKSINSLIDNVTFKKSGISLKVVIASGKEGDFFVVVSPSLNVSGYGKTREEAQQSFDENMELFCDDIISLPQDERELELVKLGFHNEQFKNNNFSKAYLDANGILKNFEKGTLEQKILETTTCA